MDDAVKIPVRLRIDAALRGLNLKSIPYYILQRGNEFSGTVLLSLVARDRSVVLVGQQRNIDGKLEFTRVHKEEVLAPAAADEYIRRASTRDPDVWVIEIECVQNHDNPFEFEC